MTDASITNTPPPERHTAPTAWARTVNDFRAPTTARKGDGARRSGNGCPERHTAAGADAAWKYLGDRKVTLDGERIPVIGETGYKQGRGLIERVGARQKTEDFETEDRSHEATGGTPVVHSSQATGGTPVVQSGDELGIVHQMPWDFWSIRKQLVVSVAIVTGVCIFVGVLGTGGMLALAVSLTAGAMVAWVANRCQGTKISTDEPITNNQA